MLLLDSVKPLRPITRESPLQYDSLTAKLTLNVYRSRSRANGATQTFRRTSQANTTLHTRENSGNPLGVANASSGVYIPPHLNSNYQSGVVRNGLWSDSRYSKDQLIGIYKDQRDSHSLDRNLADLFLDAWNPIDAKNELVGNWGKKDEGKEIASGPEVCWSHNANGEPLGLLDMSGEEKEVCRTSRNITHLLNMLQLFNSSVNSPLKPPQNTSKESASTILVGGRKTSISGNTLGAFHTSSSNPNRPGPRRRESTESTTIGANPLSPLENGKFFRDEPAATTPPPPLLRRKTDVRDDGSETRSHQKEQELDSRERQTDMSSPFESLKRSTTSPPGASTNGPLSPSWATSPQSAGFAPMGAFGSFALGTSPSPNNTAEKRPGFANGRGESRFKGLLSKTSTEEMAPSVREKSSLGSLERLPEVDSEATPPFREQPFKTRPARSETNPYGDNVSRRGSAALGGAKDHSPPSHGIDQLGFSPVGVTSNMGARPFSQHGTSQNSLYHQTPHARQHSQEPMSPTNTNPYQSPEGDRGNVNENDNDDNTDNGEVLGGGTHGFGLVRDDIRGQSFGSIRRIGAPSEDRSQTSSTGPGWGFTGLGGLSNLSGLGGSSAWQNSSMGGSTPARERGTFSSGFGESVFGGIGDVQSPNLGAIGGPGFHGSPGMSNTGIFNRTSKLGPLFPAPMQEQMRAERNRNDIGDGSDSQGEYFARNQNGGPFGDVGRRRESDNIARGVGSFLGDASYDLHGRMMRTADEIGLSSDALGSFPPNSNTALAHAQIASPGAGHLSNVSYPGETPLQPAPGLSQSSVSSSANQLPPAQQRQMVMPDRMRWIYRDPQGNTQGPWSGLEMHDWFKAGFFTAELQVKKLEDTEYEPLAQLVRRIGNSREPFLVPQIGVPHGPAAPAQGNHWAGPSTSGAVGPAPAQPGTTQPPFASSFPSFGTTLTAEQQNALERRKQEEQYLMARQKEHLAQQQVILKQMQLQGGPHGLHSLQHHSSAHSLHSQPSFGSITSPTGYQPSPIQGPIQPPQNVPGVFDGATRQPPTSSAGHSIQSSDFRSPREDDLNNSLVDRISFTQRASFPFGAAPLGVQLQDPGHPHHPIASMLQDRGRLQMEQQQQGDLRSLNDAFGDQVGQSERLREFYALTTGTDDDKELRSNDGKHNMPIGTLPRRLNDDDPAQEQVFEGRDHLESSQGDGMLSLSQQVQKAAAASAQQFSHVPAASPRNKVDSSIPPQALPPHSVSPLPAPAAQRSRQNVADTLAAESRSQTETPVEPPSTSIAPWAEKPSEASKGPSLKEIQEAEARTAAQQEEIVATARRARVEQERVVQPIASTPAPGLPSTSTWASSGVPGAPQTLGMSVWSKASSAKPSSTGTSAMGKRTLAQIQKEEENRKQRAAAAANARSSTTAPTAAGAKRYADLASRIAPVATTPPASAWTTVGSSGKARVPATLVATPQALSRTLSNKASANVPGQSKMTPQAVRNTSMGASLGNQNKATDEFTKWAKSALGKGLNNTINRESYPRLVCCCRY